MVSLHRKHGCNTRDPCRHESPLFLVVTLHARRRGTVKFAWHVSLSVSAACPFFKVCQSARQTPGWYAMCASMKNEGASILVASLCPGLACRECVIVARDGCLSLSSFCLGAGYQGRHFAGGGQYRMQLQLLQHRLCGSTHPPGAPGNFPPRSPV